LNCAGYIFLNAHSPEPSPPRLIKAISCALCKGSFHQVLSCSYVTFRFGRATLLTHLFQFPLTKMSLNRSPRFVLRALSLWALHPDVPTRSVQATFAIVGLQKDHDRVIYIFLSEKEVLLDGIFRGIQNGLKAVFPGRQNR